MINLLVRFDVNDQNPRRYLKSTTPKYSEMLGLEMREVVGEGK